MNDIYFVLVATHIGVAIVAVILYEVIHTGLAQPEEPEKPDPLPYQTPNYDHLRSCGIRTWNDLKRHKKLSDVQYIGPKRAKRIAQFLAPRADASRKWPQEIQELL